MQEIYSHNPDVKWDDIIGLDNAKRLVKEAVVYPIKVSSSASVRNKLWRRKNIEVGWCLRVVSTIP